jgi:hypothetical protein
METTDYLKQATDFLEKTGVTFKAEYLNTAKYFPDDKEERDIYQITLTRGNRSYSFKFGQSTMNSGIKIRLKTSGRITHSYNLLPEFTTKGKFDRIKFIAWHNIERFRLTPIDEIINGIPPNEYDVLACLTKYDPGTFECFCDEFGYDTDSKKAEKTYNAVKDEYLNLCTLFSPSEMEEMQEIQ